MYSPFTTAQLELDIVLAPRNLARLKQVSKKDGFMKWLDFISAVFNLYNTVVITSIDDDKKIQQKKNTLYVAFVNIYLGNKTLCQSFLKNY